MLSGKFDEQKEIIKEKKKAEGTGREETRKTRSFCVCYFSLTEVGASGRPGCPTRE